MDGKRNAAKNVDAVTRAVVDVMCRAGIAVSVAERSDGTIRVTATTPDGHRHVVNAGEAYEAVCLAAEAVGIELEDG